jgi:hypothetical protein
MNRRTTAAVILALLLAACTGVKYPVTRPPSTLQHLRVEFVELANPVSQGPPIVFCARSSSRRSLGACAPLSAIASVIPAVLPPPQNELGPACARGYVVTFFFTDGSRAVYQRCALPSSIAAIENAALDYLEQQ